MELPFEKTVCRFVRQKYYDFVTLEETQELPLPDSMPDIGRVIASWGQVVLRGKDWNRGKASLSGGVMVWLLYAPEDGSGPRKLGSWIPWKKALDGEFGNEEGWIRTECFLRNLDARNVSGRKLMLRCGVGLLVQILTSAQAEVPVPADIPEDVERLEHTYPLNMTRECGEKPFVLDEELNAPAGSPVPGELIYCRLEPELVEQKVLGSKAAFRGTGHFHALWESEDGRLFGSDFELPFAQYVDLEGEYGEDAGLSSVLCVTSLETEVLPEGEIRVKCGMVCQYTVQAVTGVTVLEDAYSPCRDVELTGKEEIFPSWLQEVFREQELSAQAELPAETVIDLSYCPESVSVTGQPGVDTVTGTGAFQVLFREQTGELAGKRVPAEVSRDWKTNCDTVCFTWPKTAPSCRKSGDCWNMETKRIWDLGAFCREQKRLTESLTLGEIREPDPERPSVIIRRKEREQSLWSLAKESGSTVSAIEKINDLQGEPEENRLLLIPVL